MRVVCTVCWHTLLLCHFYAYTFTLLLPCLVHLPQNDPVARVPITLLGEGGHNSTLGFAGLPKHSRVGGVSETEHPKLNLAI
jgi:hypothetical protein